MSDAETATQALHRLTSFQTFSEEQVWQPPVEDPRVLLDLVTNDLDRLPYFYKRYPDDLPRLDLPRELPSTTASTVDVLSGADTPPPVVPDLAQLSRLLHLAAGVVRTSQRPYGTWLFRAAGSAGGRFPLEVYVAVPDGTALPAGVHWYHPEHHALVRIGPSPRGTTPAVVVTGVPWRTGWRYRERGYRHVYWDAGTMLAQLLAAAASAGIAAELRTRFPDADVTSLVGADGVHEWPVAVVSLGSGSPDLWPAGEAAAGDVDRAPVEFPLVTAAQRAGAHDSWGPAWAAGAPPEVGVVDTPPVETVVLARGSQRRMDPAGRLPQQVLRTSLAVALRGIDVPHWVAVHGVDDVAPSLYRAPALAPVRAGLLREELYQAAMDQALASDAAFVVIAATDVGRLDDAGYRDAQLAAGLVEGRLHLLAYAMGAAASGMTFVDGTIRRLLGEPVDGLLFTCVGVPEYAAAAGGAPGAPREIRMVAPRE